METDLWCHLTCRLIREEHDIQCMPCSSRIISEMLPDTHTMQSLIFFKPIIHSLKQSTLVISKSKGPAETLRDIRTSTNQMCRIDENTKRTTKFHK